VLTSCQKDLFVNLTCCDNVVSLSSCCTNIMYKDHSLLDVNKFVQMQDDKLLLKQLAL
jgi:hypothetical protein